MQLIADALLVAYHQNLHAVRLQVFLCHLLHILDCSVADAFDKLLKGIIREPAILIGKSAVKYLLVTVEPEDHRVQELIFHVAELFLSNRFILQPLYFADDGVNRLGGGGALGHHSGVKLAGIKGVHLVGAEHRIG